MPPIDRKTLSKDQKKVLKHIEDLPIPEDKFNPALDRDQTPITEEQKILLASMEIDPSRSKKSAQSLIGYILDAGKMEGEYANLKEKRIKEVRRNQSIYPRGTLLEATYRVDDRWVTAYGKVIDLYARSAHEKAVTHNVLREKFDIDLNRPLAPFQLIILFPAGNIERVSMKYINKIKNMPEDTPTTGNSPEGSRKLR